MKRILILILLATLPSFGGWRVFWLPNPVEDEVIQYRVWLIRPPFSTAVPIASLVGTNYVFPISVLATNGVHKVYITAVNSLGESIPSTPVTFTNGLTLKGVPSPVKGTGIVYEP